MSRRRFRRARLMIELALFVLSAVLFAVTVLRPDWIEVLTGVDPDAGNGTIELAITLASGGAALAFGVLSGLEWRRRVAADVPG